MLLRIVCCAVFFGCHVFSAEDVSDDFFKILEGDTCLLVGNTRSGPDDGFGDDYYRPGAVWVRTNQKQRWPQGTFSLCYRPPGLNGKCYKAVLSMESALWPEKLKPLLPEVLDACACDEPLREALDRKYDLPVRDTMCVVISSIKEYLSGKTQPYGCQDLVFVSFARCDFRFCQSPLDKIVVHGFGGQYGPESMWIHRCDHRDVLCYKPSLNPSWLFYCYDLCYGSLPEIMLLRKFAKSKEKVFARMAGDQYCDAVRTMQGLSSGRVLFA